MQKQHVSSNRRDEAAMTHGAGSTHECSLIKQLSQSPCTRNMSFWCIPNEHAVQVSAGCRGTFSVGVSKRQLSCGFTGQSFKRGYVCAAASKCSIAELPPVFFLLTSTPDRAKRLPRVLATLRNQSLPPRGIILTLARRYDSERFGNKTFTLPAAVLSVQPSQLQVHWVDEDRGPLLKYFGALRVNNPSAIVVVGDDDIFYGPTLIEDFACAVVRGGKNVVHSNQIDNDCRWLGGCVMGFRGLAMRAAMLHTIQSFKAPAECFLADDVSVTYWLTHVRAYRVQKLALRSRHRIDGEYAASNTSTHAYHTKFGMRVNRACQRSLRNLQRSAPRVATAVL